MQTKYNLFALCHSNPLQFFTWLTEVQVHKLQTVSGELLEADELFQVFQELYQAVELYLKQALPQSP